MKKLLGGFALAGALFMMVGCGAKQTPPAENPAAPAAPAEGTTTPPAEGGGTGGTTTPPAQ